MFYFHVSADGIPPPAEHLNPAPDAVSSTDPSQANSGRPPSSSTWGFSRTPPGSLSPPSVTSEHRPHPDSASPGSSQPAASSPSESRQGGMCLLSVIMSSQFLVPT